MAARGETPAKLEAPAGTPAPAAEAVKEPAVEESLPEEMSPEYAALETLPDDDLNVLGQRLDPPVVDAGRAELIKTLVAAGKTPADLVQVPEDPVPAPEVLSPLAKEADEAAEVVLSQPDDLVGEVPAAPPEVVDDSGPTGVAGDPGKSVAEEPVAEELSVVTPPAPPAPPAPETVVEVPEAPDAPEPVGEEVSEEGDAAAQHAALDALTTDQLKAIGDVVEEAGIANIDGRWGRENLLNALVDCGATPDMLP